MSFKVGDRVRFIKPDVDGARVDVGDKGTVVRIGSYDVIVKPDIWKGTSHTTTWYVRPANIELITDQLSLPIGSQITLAPGAMYYTNDIEAGLFSVDKQEYDIWKSVPKQECDCGGFKTYKTMSPEAHSTWCKINTKV